MTNVLTICKQYRMQECKQISIKTHMERFATEELCREYLAKVR
jgi:hypothetical protein